MVRRNLSSLASGLAIVVLAVGACSAGGNATPGASANASPAAPAATVEPTPVTATATPAATSTPAPTAAASSTATHSGRILFGVRAADGSSNIFSVLPDGSDQRQLTEGARNHLCAAYSADAKRITYCSDEGGAFEVWTMDPDGTKQTQLTHLGGRALWPDLSLDGKTMAFAGVEGTDPRTQIYTVDATSGEGLVALTSCAGQAPGCSNDYPAWSPDGRSIVFIHTDDYDAKENAVNAQVWVMDADGGNQHALTTDSVDEGPGPRLEPRWLPDRIRRWTLGQRRDLGHERRRLEAAPGVGLPRRRRLPVPGRQRYRARLVPRRRLDRIPAWIRGRRSERPTDLHDGRRRQQPGAREPGNDPCRGALLAVIAS